MCLFLLSLKQVSQYPVIITANRDESYDRPSHSAKFWKDAPEVLGGRDLQSHGTWLGITRTGRFAALTNFREPELNQPGKPSRGHLVRNFLLANDLPENYLNKLKRDPQQYNGYSLIVGQGNDFFYYSNREQNIIALNQGLYGLSNHLLNTPWPKVERGKKRLKKLLSHNHKISTQTLFEMLADQGSPQDLHRAGIETEWMQSSIFVSSENYGTRCSTVLLIDDNHQVHFYERTFNGTPNNFTSVNYQFPIVDPNIG